MLYELALSFVPNVGLAYAKNLIQTFGSAEAVFSRSKTELKNVKGVGERLASFILANKNSALLRAQQELEYMARVNAMAISYFSPNSPYPALLKQCVDAPLILFAKGNLALLQSEKNLAIVGSRQPSEYGRRLCEIFLEDLGRHTNIHTVSGMALGVDALVHALSVRHALPTIGVLGHGLDKIYPRHNEALYVNVLAAGGLLLTEFSSGTQMRKLNFPRRNRIIAGISSSLLVIEAAARSGALITANLANDYNRDVFACPGRLGDRLSEGCNNLIANNKAHLIRSVQELCEYMHWPYDSADREAQQPLCLERTLHLAPPSEALDAELSDNQRAIYVMISASRTLPLNHITDQSALDIGTILTTLFELESIGLIKQLPGDLYALQA